MLVIFSREAKLKGLSVDPGERATKYVPCSGQSSNESHCANQSNRACHVLVDIFAEWRLFVFLKIDPFYYDRCDDY
jgi:hypothetical protein